MERSMSKLMKLLSWLSWISVIILLVILNIVTWNKINTISKKPIYTYTIYDCESAYVALLVGSKYKNFVDTCKEIGIGSTTKSINDADAKPAEIIGSKMLTFFDEMTIYGELKALCVANCVINKQQ